MERLKGERKGLGFERDNNNRHSFERLHSDTSITNGRGGAVNKDAQSIFESMGYAIGPRYGGADEIREPYLESWVVHACCRVIAEACEQVGFKIWDGPGDGAKPLAESHPVVKLFSKPNPWTSWSQLVSMGSIHRNLSGEDFWFLTDASGKPITQSDTKTNTGNAAVAEKDPATDPMIEIDLPNQIYSVNGTYVDDERGKNGRVAYWKYGTSRGTTSKFPAGSVLHFRNYDPTDPCRGVGPAEVALRQLSIAFQAERYGEGTMRAGGPGAFIVYEQEMLQEVQRGLQDQMDQASNDPTAVGKFKVLTGKPSVVPIPISPKDMLSIDMLAWSRDVVASLFGVPLPIIGVLDNATYSNMKEAWRQFWLRISAYLKTIEDVINTSFFPRLKNAEFKNLRFGFDLSSVMALKADDAELIKLARELVASGVGITFNQALDLVGSQATHVTTGNVSLYLAQMQTAPSEPRKQQAERILQKLKDEVGRERDQD